MVYITEDMVRRRSEHNDCEISSLEEVSLHQQDIERIEHLDRLREPPETGSDGEFRGPSEQRGVSDTQRAPAGAVPGGEPLLRVPGLQAGLEEARRQVWEQEKDYLQRRARERVEAQRKEAGEDRGNKERKPGFDGRCPVLEENKENQEAVENVVNLDLDEMRREKEFWETPCSFTPESRVEVHRHLEEKKKAKENLLFWPLGVAASPTVIQLRGSVSTEQISFQKPFRYTLISIC
ncbi:hypothetical protein FQN60_016512 [Etheostoma spectabile]|uniref:Uncharacterized protein n=1 Tax=Etheostoma spectabile TaxID=54343 RepID=A0A5J5D447_9PERO|nr:hypothetical protein FQN60_016512 [Etheostoma spectabile]